MSNRPSSFWDLTGSRLLCDVLEDMRIVLKTLNFSSLPGLVEEAQVLGNRMESKLRQYKAIKESEKYAAELKAEIVLLENKVELLEKELESPDKELLTE